MSAPEEIYVLLENVGAVDCRPIVAHTSQQGAAMEMVSFSAERQRQMWVAPVRLVDDHDE